jgi:hypothetical protein
MVNPAQRRNYSMASQPSSSPKAHSAAKQTRVEGDQRLANAALNIISLF